MEWLKDINDLAQTGITGVALIALGIIYKLATNHHHHTDTLIKDNTQSNIKLSETLGIQTEIIRSLKDTIDKKL